MKKILPILCFIIINILFIFTLLISIQIYTSQLSNKLPWYEPCGMQFALIIVFMLPMFILIGIGQFITSKFIPILNIHTYLPFFSGLIFTIPTLISAFGYIECIIVSIIGFIVMILTIVFSVLDIIKLKNWRQLQ
ncbi:hypothetical protein ACFL56_02705 [Candidatus Margulisiibacteriota bacterium]